MAERAWSRDRERERGSREREYCRECSIILSNCIALQFIISFVIILRILNKNEQHEAAGQRKRERERERACRESARTHTQTHVGRARKTSASTATQRLDADSAARVAVRAAQGEDFIPLRAFDVCGRAVSLYLSLYPFSLEIDKSWHRAINTRIEWAKKKHK